MADDNDQPHGTNKPPFAEEDMGNASKPDRNEIRGIQRKLRRTVAQTGLNEDEIRLLSIFYAAQPDALDLISIADPAERVQAVLDRQKKRAQYSDLFLDDDGVITGPIGINSARYLRMEKSLDELRIVQSATEKVMKATKAAYEDQWEYHMALLKQLAEKLAESAAQDPDDVDLTKGDTKA